MHKCPINNEQHLGVASRQQTLLSIPPIPTNQSRARKPRTMEGMAGTTAGTELGKSPAVQLVKCPTILKQQTCPDGLEADAKPQLSRKGSRLPRERCPNPMTDNY